MKTNKYKVNTACGDVVSCHRLLARARLAATAAARDLANDEPPPVLVDLKGKRYTYPVPKNVGPSDAAVRVLRGLVQTYRYPGFPTLAQLGAHLGMTKAGVRDHLLRLEPAGLVGQAEGSKGFWIPTELGTQLANG